MIREHIVCAYLHVITKYGYPPPADGTHRYLNEMRALGFSNVELEGIREKHLMEMYTQRDSIKRHLRDLNLQVPVYCTVLPGLSSIDAQERKKQIELFKYGCETASTLGANYILDNCPIAPFQFPGEIPIIRHYDDDILAKAILPGDFAWSLFYSMLVEVYQSLCNIASDHGLTYLMHPAVGTLCATPEAFHSFYDDVQCDNLGYNFDTANLIALRQNLSLALHQLHGLIPYIHISDTLVDKHQHLPLGKGCIDWQVFFDQLRDMEYDGFLGIDIGGSESEIGDLNHAYRAALNQVESYLA